MWCTDESSNSVVWRMRRTAGTGRPSECSSYRFFPFSAVKPEARELWFCNKMFIFSESFSGSKSSLKISIRNFLDERFLILHGPRRTDKLHLIFVFSIRGWISKTEILRDQWPLTDVRRFICLIFEIYDWVANFKTIILTSSASKFAFVVQKTMHTAKQLTAM